LIGWIYLNIAGYATFDHYPFILLNLAFSLQAAYAASLMLLAQTRQADRDKAHSEADAQHREEIGFQLRREQRLALEQTRRLISLVDQNNELTLAVRKLSERIESLTSEIHSKVVPEAAQEFTDKSTDRCKNQQGQLGLDQLILLIYIGLK
jgi:uncharacterized membrane protein